MEGSVPDVSDEGLQRSSVFWTSVFSGSEMIASEFWKHEKYPGPDLTQLFKKNLRFQIFSTIKVYFIFTHKSGFCFQEASLFIFLQLAL